MRGGLPLFHARYRGPEAMGDWKLGRGRLEPSWRRIFEARQSSPRRVAVARSLSHPRPAQSAARYVIPGPRPSAPGAGRSRFRGTVPQSRRGTGAQRPGPTPSWDVYHYRGRVRMAQGRLRKPCPISAPPFAWGAPGAGPRRRTTRAGSAPKAGSTRSTRP